MTSTITSSGVSHQNNDYTPTSSRKASSLGRGCYYYRAFRKERVEEPHRATIRKLEDDLANLDIEVRTYEQAGSAVGLLHNPSFVELNNRILNVLNLNLTTSDFLTPYRRRYHEIIGRALGIEGAFAR